MKFPVGTFLRVGSCLVEIVHDGYGAILLVTKDVWSYNNDSLDQLDNLVEVSPLDYMHYFTEEYRYKGNFFNENCLVCGEK